MGMGGFPAERTKKCQAPIKSGQPFPAPELQAEIVMDTTPFLISGTELAILNPELGDSASRDSNWVIPRPLESLI